MPTNDLPAAFSGSRSMALGRALRRGHVGLQLSPQEVVGVPRRPQDSTPGSWPNRRPRQDHPG